MDDDYEVIWSPAAGLSLDQALSFIAERNPSAAEKLHGQILERVELLRRTPRIGALYRESTVGHIRQTVCQRYRIFYRLEEDICRVSVLLVWHGSRREPRFLE